MMRQSRTRVVGYSYEGTSMRLRQVRALVQRLLR